MGESVGEKDAKDQNNITLIIISHAQMSINYENIKN